MSIFDEPKIDCHVHVLDPARFPYRSDTAYRPSGQEIAPREQLLPVMDAYGVAHALLVGPNSGYGEDNSCMLDALRRGRGRFKGVAVVPNDASTGELLRLKEAGVVGVAWNATVNGVDGYRSADALVRRLNELDLFLQLQVEGDQLDAFMPLIDSARPRLLVDHCGRPLQAAGLGQSGFQTLLRLGREGRAAVKLSGYAKLSDQPWPHRDAWPFAEALIEAFTLDACLWASDWPFLKAPSRVDYGPLLVLAERLVPDAALRRRWLVDTPRRLFGFEDLTG
jgi:predicted TIM-barrel fold metal-dependent hydrolase